VTKQVDRKMRDVPVGQYRYRHEAEFAAGILADAGVPYRLQLDDAGGADLGLSFLRPAILWVRAADAGDARDLVAWEEDDASEAAVDTEAWTQEGLSERPPPRLMPAERFVSAGLGVALLSAVPYVPFGPFRSILGLTCLVLGFAFLAATAVGRAPGSLERVVSTLTGSVPR